MIRVGMVSLWAPSHHLGAPTWFRRDLLSKALLLGFALFFPRRLAGSELRSMTQLETQRTTTALSMVRRPGSVDFRHPLSRNGGLCDWRFRGFTLATRSDWQERCGNERNRPRLASMIRLIATYDPLVPRQSCIVLWALQL